MRLLFVLLVSFVLGSCNSIQKKGHSARVPAQVSQIDYSQKLTMTIPDDQVLDFDKFQSLVTSGGFRSIEDVLPVLSRNYPQYLKFNTLMYASLSIQKSSFTEPRVLVFGSDAKFILTFNGNESQPGGSAFETVQYSESSHSFEYREIAFKTKSFSREDLNLNDDEIAFENSNLIISKANPGKCVACHLNSSPIWPTYFIWPGAYGSDDDQLGMSFDPNSWNANNREFFERSTKPSSQGRLMLPKKGQPDIELDEAVKYFQSRSKHPRYRWLPTAFVEPGLLRYAKGAKFSDLNYAKEAEAEGSNHYSWPARPNLFLQMALMTLNQDRILYKLREAGIGKNEFGTEIWRRLNAWMSSDYGFIETPVPGLSRKTFDFKEVVSKIHELLGMAKLSHPLPSQKKIAELYSDHLRNEIVNQQEKIGLQQANLNHSLERYEYKDRRLGLDWVSDPVQFYLKLLGKKSASELDMIAFKTETEDQIRLFLITYLLADRGFHLQDYSLNLRQESPSFYEGGLTQVEDYLGSNVSNSN
jgi:hypothetical protein